MILEVKLRTLQRRISCLRSFSNFCLRERFISIDFMSGITSPKSGLNLPFYMKLSELQQFLRFLEKDRYPYAHRNETLFKLLVTTGMRRSEITSLKWGNIDLDANISS